jgi:hypothetical protein
MRLFTLRTESPTKWYQLRKSVQSNGAVTRSFVLAKNRFPFLFADLETKLTIKKIDSGLMPPRPMTWRRRSPICQCR